MVKPANACVCQLIALIPPPDKLFLPLTYNLSSPSWWYSLFTPLSGSASYLPFSNAQIICLLHYLTLLLFMHTHQAASVSVYVCICLPNLSLFSGVFDKVLMAQTHLGGWAGPLAW